MKKIMLIICLFLSGCTSEKDLVCLVPKITNGNIRIIDYQCIAFGGSATGLIQLENTKTHKQLFYTVNVVDGHVVFNLDTSNMITISKSDEAADSALLATSLAAASMVNSSSRN